MINVAEPAGSNPQSPDHQSDAHLTELQMLDFLLGQAYLFWL